MANNHPQFIAFYDTICVTDTQESTLRTNRNVIRKKIQSYYSSHYPEEIQPRFSWQGSFAMKTILNPIKDEDGLGAYDLDDGVYFISKNESDCLSVDEYHTRILEAIKGHTSTGEEDNDPCITVLYADGHHVDLPIYFKIDEENAHPKLAHKKKGWIESDPKEFYQWFNGRSEHPQLRRLVRYLKAWCEYLRYEKGKNMPTGCIMTMLAVKYYTADNRDDVALQKILTAMYDDLSPEGGFHCYRPTFPVNEDLFKSYTEARKNIFLTELKSFKADAEKAIASTNPHDACLKWKKHFGNRFCCSTAKDEDEDAREQKSTRTLKTNSNFA